MCLYQKNRKNTQLHYSSTYAVDSQTTEGQKKCKGEGESSAGTELKQVVLLCLWDCNEKKKDKKTKNKDGVVSGQELIRGALQYPQIVHDLFRDPTLQMQVE